MVKRYEPMYKAQVAEERADYGTMRLGDYGTDVKDFRKRNGELTGIGNRVSEENKTLSDMLRFRMLPQSHSLKVP